MSGSAYWAKNQRDSPWRCCCWLQGSRSAPRVCKLCSQELPALPWAGHLQMACPWLAAHMDMSGLSLQTYSQLAHPIQQAKALGLQFHSRILDVDNIDVRASSKGTGWSPEAWGPGAHRGGHGARYADRAKEMTLPGLEESGVLSSASSARRSSSVGRGLGLFQHKASVILCLQYS